MGKVKLEIREMTRNVGREELENYFYDNPQFAVKMLKTADEDVRMAAVIALKKRGNIDDISTLREMSKNDNIYVQKSTLDVIESLQIRYDISRIREELKDWICDEILWDVTTLNAFKKLENSDDLPFIREVIGSEYDFDEWELYETACETFEALVDRENIPMVLDMLKNGGTGEQLAAIEVFKKIGNSNDFPFIRELLNDGDEDLKMTALEIFKEFGNSEDLIHIRELLKVGEGKVQEALLDAIKVLGTEDDLDLLSEDALDPGKDTSLIVGTLISLDNRLYCPYNTSKIS